MIALDDCSIEQSPNAFFVLAFFTTVLDSQEKEAGSASSFGCTYLKFSVHKLSRWSKLLVLIPARSAMISGVPTAAHSS